LNRAAGPAKPAARGNAKELTLADARKILQSEDKDTLLRVVFDWAKDDDRLHDRIIVYAARRSGPDSGAAAVRRKFEKAVRVRDFVPYREATGWARDVDDAIDSVEPLLQDGQSAAVIELCESALQTLLGSIESVDDSDGHFGVLRDRLQDIHYRACQEGRPDPVELAGRLFHWEMHSDFDVFFGAAARYASILGAKGMKAYRELADAEWEKVPMRTAKQERSEWGRHFRISHIMESLAQASGDVEQLVAVMSRDLSNAYSYLRIAEAYREAGQQDKSVLRRPQSDASYASRRTAPSRRVPIYSELSHVRCKVASMLAMPSLKIDQKQFGTKVGRHMLDFGRDPSKAEDRKWLMEHIAHIHQSPDQVRSGTFSGQGTQLAIGSHARGPVLFYAKGSDVVVTDEAGNFVTILKGGTGNKSFKGAEVLPKKP